MAEKYLSTQNTTNFARIVRCIIGPCTEMLRCILAREVGDPCKLKQLVDRALDKREELTFHQRNKLCLKCSANPNYQTFDISLMYILFRRKGICQNIDAPSKGWGKPPQTKDEISVGDDIERLRILKDAICSHAHFPAIPFPKYHHKMDELKHICERFDQILGTNFHDCVCQIETMIMDPEIAKQYEDIARILYELEEKDIDNDNRLNAVEENLKILYQRFEELPNNIYGRIDALQVKGETEVRPAKALFPERILRREDDIRIKRNYSYLLQTIQPVVILEKVHEEGIISSSLKEEITECNRRKFQTDIILKSLLRSSPDLYDTFIKLLQDGTTECKSIVKTLEDTDTTENVTTILEPESHLDEMSLRLKSNKRRIYVEVNTDDIVHCFLEYEIINLDEHSKVFNQQLRRDRIIILFNQVLAYLPWSYQVFIESLKEHHQYQLLVKQIEMTDVGQIQTGKGTLEVRNIDITPRSIGMTNRTETSIVCNVQTENAGQINEAIVSSMNSLQINRSTEKLHCYVESVEHGSIKITLRAASRLFWIKFKKICDSGEIGEFIKNFIEIENIDLLPEIFTVYFEIHINPYVEPDESGDNTRNAEIPNHLPDSYNLLVQEINYQVIAGDLFEAGVIDDKEMFQDSVDPIGDLLHYLDKKDKHVLDRFVEVLQKVGYSYIANVLLECDIKIFNHISVDDIRVIILENYTMLLDELDFDLLIKSSIELRSLSSSVWQHSDGPRRNKIHLLLKSILQGNNNTVHAFLKSLNYAGYQHVLRLLEETIEDLPVLYISEGETTLLHSYVYKGQMQIQKNDYEKSTSFKLEGQCMEKTKPEMEGPKTGAGRRISYELLEWNAECVTNLQEEIKRTLDTYTHMYKYFRIIFLGHDGSGKFSLINAFNSALRGEVDNIAIEGGTGHVSNIFIEYQAYGTNGARLNFTFCDVLGFSHTDYTDVLNALKKVGKGFDLGDGEFEGTTQEVNEKAAYAIVYVMDGSAYQERKETRVKDWLTEVLELKKQTDEWKIGHSLVLTHMDLIDENLGRDIKNIYKSQRVAKIVENVTEETKMQDLSVFPVVNPVKFVHEIPDDFTVHILYTLLGIMRDEAHMP